MTASAADNVWFRDYRRGSLYEMYCLTLIAGVTPPEFLGRIGADPQGEFAGYDSFIERDWEFQDSQDLYGDFMFVGATSLPGRGGPWTLAVEINGTVGTDDRLMGPASAGTRAVSHYRNVNALSYFSWWENGDLRTRFEHPAHRSGSTPDDLLDAIGRLGITGESDDHIAEYLALAEDLTGVGVTADILDNAVYTTGIVEMPHREWTSVVIDITDANGERLYKEVTREQVEHAIQQRAQATDPVIDLQRIAAIPPHIIASYETLNDTDPAD